MKAYCFNCKEWVAVNVNQEMEQTEIKGVKFSCVQRHAFCKNCGEEVYPDEIVNENVDVGHDAYREAMGIITVEEMKEILRKYNIGARPLSKLLGWGENTIGRQMKHTIPQKEMSDALKELSSPLKMRELLLKNGRNIKPVTYSKTEKAINSLLSESISGESEEGPATMPMHFFSHAPKKQATIFSVETEMNISPIFMRRNFEKPSYNAYSKYA